MPLKNVKLDLFGSEKCKLANLIATRDWVIMTVLWSRHAFPAVLSNYNGMPAYICRRFMPTTGFLVCNLFSCTALFLLVLIYVYQYGE